MELFVIIGFSGFYGFDFCNILFFEYITTCTENISLKAMLSAADFNYLKSAPALIKLIISKKRNAFSAPFFI